MDQQVSKQDDASFELGMHTEQLGGRSQQVFFSPEDGDNFLYPDGPDLDFNKRTEFDATTSTRGPLTRRSASWPTRGSVLS